MKIELKKMTQAVTLLICVTEEPVKIPAVVMNILKIIVVFLWPFWHMTGWYFIIVTLFSLTLFHSNLLSINLPNIALYLTALLKHKQRNILLW